MGRDEAKLAKLVADAGGSGGSEMANYQLFVERLTGALGLPQPEFAKEETRFNDYVFERGVTFRHANGTSSTGRIDCYKRGCFILEAKQSAKRAQAVDAEQLALAGIETARKAGHAKRGTKGWDKVMVAARRQAEDYARALPVDHGYPPFLLIVDVGNVIEVYADFSGLGKNYDHFPDRHSYRLAMDDLLDEQVQDRLAAIWTDPRSLDPTRRSAEVTRDIAERLARIARRLEKKHAPAAIAQFLMRCLFTMFAEDVGPDDESQRLIPNKGFETLLKQMIDTPDNFAPALETLWKVMDKGGYAPHLNASLKRFNGALFRDSEALKLDQDDIIELHNAAKRGWGEVEPSIFGTLLERALDARERASLGAHYTPRPYVERLVIPTVMEPLRADWEEAKARVEDLRRQGEGEKALQTVRDFHHRLCTVRVLDPACGTGNFLYVSLELMKRLEGEVLDALDALGENESKLLLDGETVSPAQFLGLELNPRAVPIAELVLWIGFLKWQLRTVAVKDIPEPILNAYGTIREQDALIAYDAKELARDAQGRPLTIWDGVTTRAHPITGEQVPDESARAETYRYVRPRRAEWPAAEYIVGNPPFIGGKDMRAELGDGYAEACWQVRPEIPGGADFVMHFWDEAARRLTAAPAKGKGASPARHPRESGGPASFAAPADEKRDSRLRGSDGRDRAGANSLRRFGFITTNSITQTFSRRVVERWMNGARGSGAPLSLVHAIPDHPWLKASDKAAVRIAMTVAEAGSRDGVLAQVVAEEGLNTDTPKVALERREGRITSTLSIGADLSKVQPLLANEAVASPGVKLHGAGFIVTPQQARALGLGSVPGLERHILHYRHGRDLAQRARGVMVIDLYGLTVDEVRDRFPAVYQHVVDRVKPERDSNREAFRRENWWIFGRRHTELRDFLDGLPRYIATVETSKHRFFQFLDASIRPDNMLTAFGVERADQLAILSSRLHVHWMLGVGGTLEDRPRYNKTRCFDPFPFPLDTSPRLAELGETLDAFRKERLAAHDFLTMTGLYNSLERVRELDAGIGEPLSAAERDSYEAGRIAILKALHDDIDREAFAAYGWSDLGERLVGRPGGTVPTSHGGADQEAAEEELLIRLVALNQARAADEQAGVVHWLRPDYQRPRLGRKVKGGAQVEADLGLAATIEAAPWPGDGLEQIRAVRERLLAAAAPIAVPALSAAFKGRDTPRRRQRVSQVLETLVATGAARRATDGGYYAPR